MTKSLPPEADSVSPSRDSRAEADTGFYSIIDYTVDGVETQRRLVDAFAEIQQRWVRFYPGYRAARFYASVDGTRVYNIVHWESEATFREFERTSDADGRWAAIQAALAMLPGAEPRMSGAPRYTMVREVAPGPQLMDGEPRTASDGALRSIEVYIDFVCPWCFIAKRRIDAALSQLADRDRISIVWRSYELSPKEGRTPGRTAEELIREWRKDEADARIARIRTLGTEEGLELNLDRARPVNTFDAHRLMHLAATRGRANQTLERLFVAYHTEGRNIADPQVLATLAGLDASEVNGMLTSTLYADRVHDDERRAAERGIKSVPTIVLPGEPPASGLQSTTELVHLSGLRPDATELRDFFGPKATHDASQLVCFVSVIRLMRVSHRFFPTDPTALTGTRQKLAPVPSKGEHRRRCRLVPRGSG